MVRALLLSALLVALAGCQRSDDRLRLLAIEPDPKHAAELLLRIQLPHALADGLRSGVPLSWRLDLERDEGRQSHWRELRYLPLSRQYQVREPASGYSRSYPSQAAALAALERWPLPSGGVVRSVRVRLDTTRLPGPLVLPALFHHDWRLDSGLLTP